MKVAFVSMSTEVTFQLLNREHVPNSLQSFFITQWLFGSCSVAVDGSVSGGVASGGGSSVVVLPPLAEDGAPEVALGTGHGRTDAQQTCGHILRREVRSVLHLQPNDLQMCFTNKRICNQNLHKIHCYLL